MAAAHSPSSAFSMTFFVEVALACGYATSCLLRIVARLRRELWWGYGGGGGRRDHRRSRRASAAALAVTEAVPDVSMSLQSALRKNRT